MGAVLINHDTQIEEKQSEETTDSPAGHGLWKYCTPAQCRDFILSLNLIGSMRLSSEKQLALLYGLSNHTEDHYAKKKIPKRNGGFRTLYAPDPLLKYVQRQILRKVLVQFPVSGCACAYRSGASTRDNALPHVGKEKILKLDIHDFFGSITSSSVYGLAFPGTVFPPQVRGLLTSLCCLRGRLPQGSPASPAISNLVMRPFDEHMGLWCRERNIRYSRYCDDMTFSGSFDAGEVIRKVSGFLSERGMRLNWKKTGVYGKNCRQEVTGLTVNEKVQLPKELRRQLRMECYYCRRFGTESHMERLGLAESESEEHFLMRLLGRLEYALSVSPGAKEFEQEREYFREQLKALRERRAQKNQKG